ncbi:MAG: hypothetical protein WAK48_04125 [Candidatus Acidiferrum sp.]|jgi:hypothetical protein
METSTSPLLPKEAKSSWSALNELVSLGADVVIGRDPKFADHLVARDARLVVDGKRGVYSILA